MISILLLFLPTLIPLAAPAEAPAAVLSPATVPDAALGATTYEVRFVSNGLNLKVAEATIGLERATREGEHVLHANAVIHAVSIFRLFLNAEYIADAYLLPETRQPIYYMNPVKKTGKFECIYDRASKTVTTEFVRPPAAPEKESFPLDGRTMDLLSLLENIRFIDLPEGESLNLRILKAGVSVPGVLTYEGADNERFTGREAKRFLVLMPEKGLMENNAGNRIAVWVSAGPERQMLGLEVDLGSGVMSAGVR